MGLAKVRVKLLKSKENWGKGLLKTMKFRIL